MALMMQHITKLVIEKRVPDAMVKADFAHAWATSKLTGDPVHIPKSFIDFHQSVAQDRLVELADFADLTIEHTRMSDSGWGDGMVVLESSVLTSSGNSVPLVYDDRTQAFMLVTGRGSRIKLYSSDLV